jgi:hypothetical protein
LPTGARIKGIRVAHDDLGITGTVLHVGDSADNDRYYASISVTQAGSVNSILVDAMDYVVGTTSGDNQVVITCTGGSSATGTIKIAIQYTQD